MQDRKKSTLILLIFLFLFLRLAVLFTYLDNLYEPEELYRGTVAHEIINGLSIPLWEYLDYKVEYFPGGTLVVGILAVPFFLLFGETYIALKLVGLFFALGTFILWFIFLDIFFSRKLAVIVSLLSIFCMPFYTKTSLITWGAHPEANFFTILAIFIFSLIFFKRDRSLKDTTDTYPDNKKYFFALGIVCGFGLWFVQTYLLTVSFLFMLWFIFDRYFFIRKSFWVFVLGFLFGFLPGIAYLLFSGGDIFKVNGDILFANIVFGDLAHIPKKAAKLLFFDLPGSFLFSDFFFIKGIILSYLYYLVFIVGFIYICWVNKKQLMKLAANLFYPVTLIKVKRDLSKDYLSPSLLLYPLLFVLAYSFSDFSVSSHPWSDPEVWLDYIGYRYMIPIIPFILFVLGFFICIIKKKKIISFMLFFALLSLGLMGNMDIISLDRLGRYFNDKGYSYNIIGDKIGLRKTSDLSGYIAAFGKLDNDSKIDFYEGLGAGIAWRLRDGPINDVIKTIRKEIRFEYAGYCYRGWGQLYSPDYPQEFDMAFKVANAIDSEDDRKYFFEGLGRNMAFFEEMNKTIECIDRVPEQYRVFSYVGLGYAIGFEFKNDPLTQKMLVDGIGDGYREFVKKGVIYGSRMR